MVADLIGTASRLWREASAWRGVVIGAGMLSVVATLHVLSGGPGYAPPISGPSVPDAPLLPSNPASDVRLADYESAYNLALKISAAGERCEAMTKALSSLTPDDEARGRNVRAASKERIAALSGGQRCRDSIRASDGHFDTFERLISAAETQRTPASVKAAAEAPAKLDAFDQSRVRYAGEAALLLKARTFAANITTSDAHIAALLSAVAAFGSDKSVVADVALADAAIKLTDFDRGRLTDAQRASLNLANQAVGELNASHARLAKLMDLVSRTQNGTSGQLGQQLLDATAAVTPFDEAVATPDQKAAITKARLAGRQLAWSQLAARVRGAATGDSPEAVASVASAYSLLKDISPADVSGAQQALLAQGQAAVKSLADSDARLSALLAAADQWQHRDGATDRLPLVTFQSITAFDRKRFKDAHTVAWNQLARADAIMRGPEIGLTASTKDHVLIYVFSSGNGDLNRRVAIALKDRLRRDAFQIADDRNQAALLVDVTVDHIDADTEHPDLSDGSPRWIAKADIVVNATWVVDDSSLLAKHITEQGSSQDRSDQKFAAVRKAVASAADAFDRLVR